MDIFATSLVVFLASLMAVATPILLAAIGELVVEKSGVLNLGVEGMMVTGAMAGIAISVSTGSWVVGLAGAAVGGALLSLVFAVLTLKFMTNQVATGLGLTLFGLGVSALIGQTFVGVRAPSVPSLDIPILSDLPFFGTVLFSHDATVYLGLLLVALVWWFLTYTRGGLILRAVGEEQDAAHALGYKVVRVRMMAILFGGACAGLGGATLSMVRVQQWTDGMTAGAGWIALAIVVFASWRPWRLLAGAYLFGGVGSLQLNLQGWQVSILDVIGVVSAVVAVALGGYALIHAKRNVTKIAKTLAIWITILAIIAIAMAANRFFNLGISVDETLWLSSSPYIVTILVLVVLSSDRAPKSLGKSFFASR